MILCGSVTVSTENIVTENEYKLYNSPLTEGYVFFSIPDSCDSVRVLEVGRVQ